MFGNGTGVRGVRDLGAALQIVKRGFGGDASETVTGLQSFLTAVVKHAPQLEKAGVKGLFTTDKNGKKELADVFTIVDAIGKSSLVKDPTAMEKAFGRVEAYRAYLQLSQNREELQKMSDAGEDATTIQKDLDTYMSSAAGRTSKAMEHLKNTIAEAFTPERFEKFANMLEKVTDGLGTVVGTLDHFINGPSGEAAINNATSDFIEQANPESGDSQKANAEAVARAKHVLETQAGAGDYAEAIGEQKYGSLENYKAGAKKFLLSQGGKDAAYVNDTTNTTGYAINAVTQQANKNAGREFVQRGLDAFGLSAKPLAAKDIAQAVVAGLQSVNLQITVDGKVLATTVKKSPTHRHGVSK